MERKAGAMNRKLLNETIKPVITIDFGIMLAMGIIALIIKKPLAGIIILAAAVLSRVFHFYISERNAKNKFAALHKNLQEEADEMTKAFAAGSPLLTCMVSADGKLLWANDRFAEFFSDQEVFDKYAGKKFTDLFFDEKDAPEDIAIENKVWRVNASPVARPDGSMARMLFWQDISEQESIRQILKETKPCVAVIEIDNYDELIESAPIEEQSTIAASLDVAIRTWSQEMEAGLVKLKASRYAMFFENKHLTKLRENRFAILDRMHEIETKADFPTSLSIGISVGEASNEDLLESATEAVELAQARGGDQAVVRNRGGQAEYYGGTLPTVEKRNKGKSRVLAHSLARLISASDKVFIMGHVNPDMDALGAASGVYALAKNLGKSAAVVLDEPSEGIEIAYRAIRKEEGELSFISHDLALEMTTPSTLVVVVDCHRAAIAECPELLEKAGKLAVIDHHRKAADAIEGADLLHIEVYASSSSELISEMLQYSGNNGTISKFKAELLLAGIVLDTKNFTMNTGVRTFDAAAWLRRHGAENNVIKEYYKVSLEMFQKKANIIANAEILSNGIAVAYTRDSDSGMQILAAQVADELLDMKGVEASFVAGRIDGRTTVSARSNGKINVQVIMEALGGGGHQNVAGAQVDESPEEAIAKIVKIMREQEIL